MSENRAEETLMPITATVDQFAKLSGISRSRIYVLLSRGALRSVNLMGRRLIVVESYRDLLRQLGEG